MKWVTWKDNWKIEIKKKKGRFLIESGWGEKSKWELKEKRKKRILK